MHYIVFDICLRLPLFGYMLEACLVGGGGPTSGPPLAPPPPGTGSTEPVPPGTVHGAPRIIPSGRVDAPRAAPPLFE